MGWSGLSDDSGRTSAYANRGGSFPSSYRRRGVGGYRSGAGVGGGFGSFYGGGLNSSALGAYRSQSHSTDSSNRGTGTARVAVVGVSQTAFMNWWAIHAAAFQVSVVVGVDDRRSCTDGDAAGADATSATVAVSNEERSASAETARAFAVRCTQFYHLPQRPATSTAAAKTAGAAVTHPSSSAAPTTATTASQGGSSSSEVDVEKGEVLSVRVRIADDAAASASPPPTSAATTAVGAVSAKPVTQPYSDAETTKDTTVEPCITATAWSYFMKPYADAQKAGSEEKKSNLFPSAAAATSTSYWSTRSTMQDNSSNVAAVSTTTTTTTPLVDDVEIVYVASLQGTQHESARHSGVRDEKAAADEDAEVRAVLVWLIGNGKHLVVDCALSSETLAACAAAASTVTRGKPEMQHVVLYRGGGVRRGWSPAAMGQLRNALAVRRGTGQATEDAKKDNTNDKKTDNVPNAAAAAPAKLKTAEADDAFSVFDFLGGGDGGRAFSGALKAAEGDSGTSNPSTSASNANTTTKETETREGDKTDAAARAAQEEAGKAAAALPVATSIAVDPDNGVTGTVRQLRFTVRSSSGSGTGQQGIYGVPCASSLGVMDTVGWDAVAWLLHLLDWTCPDVVQGRVVRRRAGDQAPLCVEAELHYSIDGTVIGPEEMQESNTHEEAGESRQKQPVLRVARPAYLRVLLHVGASGEGGVGAGPGAFQQLARVVGTKAVLTVDHPLLPAQSHASLAASTMAAAAAAAGASTPPPSTANSSPFKVTTTRTMGLGGATSLSHGGATAELTTTANANAPILPAVPSVVYSYVVATQDAPPSSLQRVRKEQTITVPGAEGGEPCAEVRLWQHLRAQLNVTATTTDASSYSSSLSLGYGGVGGSSGSGYRPFGSRYATRGRYGVNIGRGSAAGGNYGSGRGGLTAAGMATPRTVVKAELTAPEAAAMDVQRAWLVQMVVEQILASAAMGC